MERLSTQVESQNRKNLEVEWRRSKVIELNSQGYSQPETAKILQIGLGTVNRELSVIRQKARKNLEEHIQRKLPEEYNRCLIIKHVIQIQKDANVLQRLDESIKADEEEMTTNGVF